MVSATELQTVKARVRGVRVALGTAALAALLLASGCASAPKQPQDTRTGYGMGGVKQDIVVTRAALAQKPSPADLSTPESAVRSYMDWISYSYRIGESDVASHTMTPAQGVRVDAYNQLNLQKEQLIDQKLDSVTFGKPRSTDSTANISAQEKWTYRYVSIKKPGETLRGPYTAQYETDYTLVKTKDGWKVDKVNVKDVGTIK